MNDPTRTTVRPIPGLAGCRPPRPSMSTPLASGLRPMASGRITADRIFPGRRDRPDRSMLLFELLTLELELRRESGEEPTARRLPRPLPR